MWFWWSQRHIDQWNTIENLEIDPYKYAQLIFFKHTKVIQWKEDKPFQ